MDVLEYTRALRESRMRVAKEMEEFIDECHTRHPGEPFTGEESEKWERFNARVDELDRMVRDIDEREQRERDHAAEMETLEQQLGNEQHRQVRQTEDQQLRAWLRGELRTDTKDWEGKQNTFSVDVARGRRELEAIRAGASPEEVRTLLWDTGSSGSLVPTTFARRLYEYMEASVAAFRMPTTKIQTASGEAMDFPRVAAHGIATQVIAQGTAIGGTDPTFGKMTLDAYKYGHLVQLASEVVQDSAIDIVDFVGRNVARGIARLVDADLVVGTGTGEPKGIMAAPTVFTSTGGSLIDPDYENLVDLQHAVVDEYRNADAAWLARDATAAVLRKLRDGAGGTEGAPLWQPSVTMGLTVGAPDRLLGFPFYTDPNVASLASDAKVLAFGDFSAYYIRQVGNVVFERSDEYAFNNDLITFRGKWRLDGDLIDANAIAVMKRNV